MTIDDVTARRLLELLVDDTTREALEEPLRAARRDGIDQRELTELAADTALALRARDLLERSRRREAELGALFDTARDLTALDDVDDVLAAIVRRARQLLGTDVSYLTLLDRARGDTHMRVTDGSVSAAFQRVRLPLGAGLGGLVAQTGNPYATADYFADGRFAHTGDIDAAVKEEGLVAILGVPLSVGGSVIGVLFAADRAQRPFTPAEIALLGSLAAHAAVALESTRLLVATRAAVDELNAAGARAAEHAAAVERAAEAHDRMTALVLHGGELPELASAVVEVLGGELLVVDETGHRLAATRASLAPEVASAVAVALVEPAGPASRSMELPHLGAAVVAPVIAGGERLAHLVLYGAEVPEGADRRILERAALVTALVLLFRRAAAEAENQVRGELLADVLSAAADPVRLVERARRLGIDLQRPWVVVAAGAEQVGRRRLATAASGTAAGLGGLAAEHDGVVVLLLTGSDPGAAARTASTRLAAATGVPVSAGAAGPGTGPDELAAAYRQARHCLDALPALGRSGEGLAATELGFAGLLLGGLGSELVTGFVTATIGPLVDYDTRRGTDLTGTVETYFAQDGSPARCAGPLHVHVNTVAQRLERVGRLLGEDWRDPDRSLQIRLALHLHRLRG